MFAWGLGWILMLEYTLASSTLAVGFSSYLTSLMRDFGVVVPPFLSTPLVGTTGGFSFNLVAVLAIAAVTAVLCAGVRQSAGVNAFLVVVKVAVLAVVITFGVGAIDPGNWKPFIPPHEGEFAFGWPGIVRAASILFFAYLGFETVSTAASESRNPQRDLPIGILGALFVCTALYLAVAAVLTGVVPYRELGVADPVALAVDRMGRPGIAIFVKVGALMGLASVLLVNAYGQSRITFQMARDGMLPAIFSRVHERFLTPYRGIIVLGAVSAVCAAFFPIADAGGPREPRRGARVRDRLLLHDVAALEAAGPAAPVSRAARRIPGWPRLDRLHPGDRARALHRHDPAGADRHRLAGGLGPAADGGVPWPVRRDGRALYAVYGRRNSTLTRGSGAVTADATYSRRRATSRSCASCSRIRWPGSSPWTRTFPRNAAAAAAARRRRRAHRGARGAYGALQPALRGAAARRARDPAVQRPAGLHLAVLGQQPDLGPDLELRGRAVPRDDRVRRTPARLDAHLDDLVGAMERGRPNAWHPSEMGARYETLKRMIVPFEAKVLEQRAKFKLGQDERDTVFAEITEALGRSGPDGLLAWMRELNPGR